MLDRVDGQLHQVAAVVIGTDFDIGWQDVPIELAGHRFHAGQHILRLLAAPHHDDAFHGVIRVVEAKFSQARRVSDGYIPNVADAHRHAVLAADDDISDILSIPDETEAADVVELSALRIESATGVGVIVSKLLQYGRYADVVGVELCRVKQHLVLHYGAAEP